MDLGRREDGRERLVGGEGETRVRMKYYPQDSLLGHIKFLSFHMILASVKVTQTAKHLTK